MWDQGYFSLFEMVAGTGVEGRVWFKSTETGMQARKQSGLLWGLVLGRR